MNCQKARLMIDDFINDKMDYGETLPFIEHVRSCESCYEDLELNYLIHKALNELEGEEGGYSLSQAMEMALVRASHKHTGRTRVRTLVYIAVTLAFWAVVFLVMLSVRAGIIAV